MKNKDTQETTWKPHSPATHGKLSTADKMRYPLMPLHFHMHVKSL